MLIAVLMFPQAIRDVHIFVVVNILVVLDVIIIGLYLLIAGLRGDLGVDLVPNRENPVDLIGVSPLSNSLHVT